MVVSDRFHGRDSVDQKTEVSRKAHTGKRARFGTARGELSDLFTRAYEFSTILESLFHGPPYPPAPQR